MSHYLSRRRRSKRCLLFRYYDKAFKRVLEPLVRPTVEGWRGRRYEAVVDEMWQYAQDLQPALDWCDRRDRVVARHLGLNAIFDAFYGSNPISLIAAGEPGHQVYGGISDGTHRLFVAQALGTIDTLPAWVSWRTRKLSSEEIAAREKEQQAWAEATDVVVINVSERDW